MDEREAIARLRHGDIGGLEDLVNLYQLRAVRAAFFVTRDEGLAQEVVQAAFVKAYEKIGQFDPTRPFGPWFLTSVLRDAQKAAARRDRQISLDAGPDDESSRSSDFADDALTPEELWERAETAAEVWAALGRLSPEQRSAVVARYFLDWSEAEMAERLASPVSAIKWRLHAARHRLRLWLRPFPAKIEQGG
jgi:RNA polymerase sigma-70 factor (ECF subfamily)